MSVVDIDVPQGYQIVLVCRPDGTTTVSVPQDVFEDAIDKHNLSMLSISSPKMREYLAQAEPVHAD